MAELTPLPLAALIRRAFREFDERQSIFDLPARRFFGGSARHDYSIDFHGRRLGSPLGPAAGPHTQMAQNLVLSWLAGSRTFELKTVQILDELKIPRPCIDVRTVGFNIEWSQELKLEQSLDEYVKGAMLIEILRAAGVAPQQPGFERMAIDMSVGYDLKGIQSPRVATFIDGLLNAGPTIDRLRREIPAEFARWRDLDFTTRLSDTLTLSTFHGCPPHEITAIMEHLMEAHRLHTVVKFNPTLLGQAETMALLHGVMGYTHITVPETAFTRDTTWDQAVEITGRLGAKADALGLGFGVKFSNTLIVLNDQGFLAPSEREAYLSGPPLHVLAVNLVRRFRGVFEDRWPVSFSAGIDRQNFADAAALGLVPITVCTDLLKPGGYGRLSAYYEEIDRRMDAVGAHDLDEFAIRAYGLGEEALDRLPRPAGDATVEAARAALHAGADLRAAAGDLFADWVSSARMLNTDHYAPLATAATRYHAARNARPPKKMGRHLQLFDCISCDKCVPVCPNDANFTFTPPEREIPVVTLVRDGAAWRRRRGPDTLLAEDHQFATFIDFCNECGNCDVFCPEDGGPYLIKPRFFGSETGWRDSKLDGFFVKPDGGLVLGRCRGVEYRLERAGGRFDFSGPGCRAAWDTADPDGTLKATGPDEIDLTWGYVLEAVRRGILQPGSASYVTAR